MPNQARQILHSVNVNVQYKNKAVKYSSWMLFSFFLPLLLSKLYLTFNLKPKEVMKTFSMMTVEQQYSLTFNGMDIFIKMLFSHLLLSLYNFFCQLVLA